jgi:uncharacterized protein (DUF362 family)
MSCPGSRTNKTSSNHQFSRRQFLGSLSAAAAGLIVGGPKIKQVSAAGVFAGNSLASTADLFSYDRPLVRAAIEKMLDDLGGLGDIIQSGDTVGIKINLTGGAKTARDYQNKTGLPPEETYWTHPEVLRATGELIKDAGASKIYVIESLADWDSYTDFGYEDVVDYLGASFIDLEDPKADSSLGKQYVQRPVGDKSIIFHTLTQHPVYNAMDCFISLPKAKAHQSACITHGLKNQIGSVPIACGLYNNGGTYRGGLHQIRINNSGDTDKNLITSNNIQANLQRVILDLNNATPFQLVINDAIKTIAGGENPQQSDPVTPISWNKMIASKDPIAADSISTQVIGFDPMDSTTWIVDDGINYLEKAAELGMGNYDITKIDVIDSTLADVAEHVSQQPAGFELGNYPNPFNMETTFEVRLLESGYVSLDILDSRGRFVRSLVSRSLQGGRSKFSWNGKNDRGFNVPSGVYIGRLRFNGFEKTHRLALVK